MSRSHEWWSGWWHGWVSGCLCCLMLTLMGCATDQAVIDAERESEALVSDYKRGAETAVTGLLGAYVDASLGELRAVTELAILEEVEVLVETDGESVTEREVVRPDVAREAARLSIEKVVLIYQEAERFRAAWDGSRQNLADAVALRRRIREYLMAGGVQAEHIDELAEALARRLKER